jgi:hypothetical protein
MTGRTLRRLPVLVLASSLAAAGQTPPGAYRVSRGQIAEAMHACQGFDPVATANGARLNGEVLLRLVRAAQAAGLQGGLLFFDREDWFQAFLERTGLAEDGAPLYVRLARQHGQDTLVDFRPGRVIRRVVQGPVPRLAVNVRIAWEARPGAPASYSYDDLRSTPTLRVTSERVISYRLLDYGDMVVFDQVSGLKGRPTSGPLGVLFDLIGEASLVESRMAVASDGIQISRGRGKKGFLQATSTVTIYPDGRAEKGLPPNRPDLAEVETRLKQAVELVYEPMELRP